MSNSGASLGMITSSFGIAIPGVLLEHPVFWRLSPVESGTPQPTPSTTIRGTPPANLGCADANSLTVEVQVAKGISARTHLD